MEVKILNRGLELTSNSYLLIDDDNHGLLIDCGNYLSIKDEISKLAKLDGVIVTHAHYDHIRGLNDLKKDYLDCPIYFHDVNVPYFEDPFYNLSKFIDEIEPVSVLYDKKSLNEGKIKIGNFDLEIIYTPGHSLDGISILWKNNLFTGDFLFYNTVGRVDLPTSNLKDLTNSLTKIIPYLKDGVIIYPGHGKECKKQTLVKINPYIIATIGDKNV